MSDRQFPIGVHATIADLQRWHLLTAACIRCGHHAELAPASLSRRQPKTTLLRDLEKKLKCRECGGKLVQLTVRNMPR
jgi:hypothetical protein